MKVTTAQWAEMVSSGAVVALPSDQQPKGFLMFGQWMDAIVMYKNCAHRCVGWHPPSGAPYVKMAKIKK